MENSRISLESESFVRDRLLARVTSASADEIARIQDSIVSFVKDLEERHGGRELLATSPVFLALIGTEPRDGVQTHYTRADQEICDFVRSL